MSSGQLLGICGSLREASSNRMLMREAARLFDPASFLEGDIRFPLYDGDLEAASGIPAEVQRLADQIKDADAVVIATPEYNKNLLWRAEERLRLGEPDKGWGVVRQTCRDHVCCRGSRRWRARTVFAASLPHSVSPAHSGRAGGSGGAMRGAVQRGR